MICPRCGRAMREQRRSHHKQRKWICPTCRKVRMQAVGVRRQRRHDAGD